MKTTSTRAKVVPITARVAMIRERLAAIEVAYLTPGVAEAARGLAYELTWCPLSRFLAAVEQLQTGVLAAVAPEAR